MTGSGESAYVGAYWGSRRESVESCAGRLSRCMAGLAEADPALARWYRTARSRTAARTPVPADAAGLADLLARGRNRRDDTGEAIEELGFSVGMWNRSRPEVGLRASVGKTSGVNAVVLRLPAPAEGPQLYRGRTARAVMGAVAETWQPRWATWTTDPWREAQAADLPRGPVVGWLTYLGGVDASDIPVEVAAERLADGVLVASAPDHADVIVPQVLGVRQHLVDAGALLRATIA